MTTTPNPATAKPAKAKKAANKPAVEAWQKEFDARGLKTRTNYTRPPKAADVKESYVTWEQVAARSFDDFAKFIGGDKKRLLKFALAGYNAEQRQSAAFGEQRITRMVDSLLEMNPKLTREKAEARVRAALAEQ